MNTAVSVVKIGDNVNEAYVLALDIKFLESTWIPPFEEAPTSEHIFS
jgi:hypothetical protein